MMGVAMGCVQEAYRKPYDTNITSFGKYKDVCTCIYNQRRFHALVDAKNYNIIRGCAVFNKNYFTIIYIISFLSKMAYDLLIFINTSYVVHIVSVQSSNLAKFWHRPKFVSPTASWIRWCMQVYACELMCTCLVCAERSTPDSFWVPSHRFNSATGSRTEITDTIWQQVGTEKNTLSCDLLLVIIK